MSHASLLLPVALLFSSPAVEPASAGAVYPLERGFVWHYLGTVRWTEGTHVREKEMKWPVRIVDSIRRGEQTIALVDGWVSDLAWYDPEKKARPHLLVHQPGRGVFFLEDGEAEWKRVRIKADETVSTDRMEDDTLLLPLDLREGQEWGDRTHPWRVEEVGTQKQVVSGWSGPDSMRFFRIVSRTGPDHTVFDFAPGLGITRYKYVHHGTVSECDLRLVAIERRPAAVEK